MEFAYDGGGLGKGGNVTLYYDGEKAGEGRVQATQPLVFSADETTDIGEDNHDHLINPEELIRIAMARQ
jgi:hypothetical protein